MAKFMNDLSLDNAFVRFTKEKICLTKFHKCFRLLCLQVYPSTVLLLTDEQLNELGVTKGESHFAFLLQNHATMYVMFI